MKNTLTILIAIILISVSGASAQKDETKTIAAVTGLVREMASAQTSFDQATLDRILTDDYVEISPAGEFDPREKVLGFYKPELKPAVVPSVVASDLSVRIYKDYAIVITKLNFVVPNAPPTAPVRAMRATFVCRKEKSGWKISSAQYTGIRPAAPPVKN